MPITWIDKFTKGFFWFGFVVFLSASIPHIAAYYRHFDPNTTGLADTAAWVIGYLIAIVIDVTDVLVSIAVLKEINRGTKKRNLMGYWAFIVFVMGLSWLINYQYNIVYGTNAFARADSQQILGITMGSINPVIGSAFQLLILVYTAMAHKFAEKPVVKTVAQLKEEADEAEARQTQLDRLAAAQPAAQGESFIEKTRKTLQEGKAAFKELRGIKDYEQMLEKTVALYRETPESLEDKRITEIIALNFKIKKVQGEALAKQALLILQKEQLEAAQQEAEWEEEQTEAQEEEASSSSVSIPQTPSLPGQYRDQQLPETSEEQPIVRYEENQQVLFIGTVKYWSIPRAAKEWKVAKDGRYGLKTYVEEKRDMLLEQNTLFIQPGRKGTMYVRANAATKNAIFDHKVRSLHSGGIAGRKKRVNTQPLSPHVLESAN